MFPIQLSFSCPGGCHPGFGHSTSRSASDIWNEENIGPKSQSSNPCPCGTFGIPPADSASRAGGMPKASRDRSLGTLIKNMRRFSLLFVIVCLCLTSCTPNTQTATTPYISELTKKITEDPESGALRADRGFAYAMLGLASDSFQDFRDAIVLEPDNLKIRWSYGWAAFNLSNYERALEQWQFVIDHSPKRPWWVGHTLAICYWELKRPLEAVAYYNEAVTVAPTTFSTRTALLEYTDFWTYKERQSIEKVYDAWKRAYDPNKKP